MPKRYKSARTVTFRREKTFRYNVSTASFDAKGLLKSSLAYCAVNWIPGIFGN